ncbi:hypothetical protein [Actinocrispum wychmicini]|uniref:Uncharacterized protein n=1 Tax=Actinocrispum wychmicini TaxID=1213861 RepID=A0A4R2JFK0_9PSEU|nr:hypothetical protein [Actinocrispum wychmicini]TCO55059.1 hypothetical protein EV192_108347 [Actinocrispum wychmicini]
MAKRIRVVGALALAGGLLLPALPANAQVEGGGWTPWSPSFKVQQVGCGTVDDLTFKLSCSSGSGEQRAERRYTTYSTGTHQFEGSFRITSMGGSRISLKQTFGASGPFFLLAVERGGRLYSVEGGATIATGATVGTTVRVNTVNQVGSTHRTYINGSLKNTTSSPNHSYYDKFGAYRTASGAGPITVVWSGIRFWQK